MGKKKVDPDQMDLFDALKREGERMLLGMQDSPGGLNMSSAIRSALYESIKGSSLSRWEIAAKMSELTDCEISKFMLDAWTCETKEGHRFPLEFAAAFCRATGSNRVLEVVCQPVGVFAMAGPDALRSQKQKLADQMSALRTQEREIEKMIKLFEKGGG